ncbi:MAG: hypothetical protein OEO23_14655, partial [Gemmatimonadota bacterium]|nr:hypothetical protein [Gemmatimonadota bacterium]
MTIRCRYRPDLLAVLFCLASCGDGESPVQPPQQAGGFGSILVSLQTAGTPLSPASFTITLDGGAARPVAPDGEVLFDSVSVGTHQVTLADLSANCALDGPESRSASVVAGGAARVRLFPWCVPPVPAGVEILYVSGDVPLNRGFAGGVANTDLAAIRADGRDSVTLVAGPHPDSMLSPWRFADPVWSPSGSAYLVVRHGALFQEIWLAQADGSGISHVTAGRLPTWAPDGNRVAYILGDAGISSAVHIVNLDGTDPSRVDLGAPADYVSWSPQGDRLAVEVAADVIMVDDDGSDPRPIGGPIDGARRGPSWSPDGTRLIYRVTFGNGNPWALWTGKADGSGESLLFEPDGGASARRATWSPTGDRVLFSRYTVQCGPNSNNACPPNLFILPG